VNAEGVHAEGGGKASDEGNDYESYRACSGPPAPARFDPVLVGTVDTHASAFAALSSWGMVEAGALFT
jgi:hypothetical protein